MLPKLTRYKEDTSEYKVNRYQLPAELREAITQRCGGVISRGYHGHSILNLQEAKA